MSTQILLVLLTSVLAGGANVIGGLIVASRAGWTKQLLRYCLAFGAGFILAAAALRMIPISIQARPDAALLVLAGYFFVHLFEHTVSPHFHFGEETHAVEAGLTRQVGFSAVFGLVMHAFFDGVTISSGFAVTPALGLLLFLAILLHKLPEGFSVASLALASGHSRRWAVGAAAVVGISTVVGGVAASFLSSLMTYALAFSAGVAIYVAATDLIPEVNREPGIKMSFMVFLGVALFYITERLLEMLGV